MNLDEKLRRDGIVCRDFPRFQAGACDGVIREVKLRVIRQTGNVTLTFDVWRSTFAFLGLSFALLHVKKLYAPEPES